MNIRPNNIGQQRPSPQQKPLSAKALAEQLKAEGEAEVTRGEELQKDGVVLQTKGTVMAEGGKTSVQIGEGSVVSVATTVLCTKASSACKVEDVFMKNYVCTC